MLLKLTLSLVFRTSFQGCLRLFPADTRSIYTNLGKTRTIGMDTDVKVDVTRNVYLYFNLTLQDIRD
ncbi:MAG: hypothetical protein ACFNS5_11690, partial [Prevotella melaninogenica]